VAVWGAVVCARGAEFAKLEGSGTEAGYLARLLINEAAFPGERGWVSEEDSKDTMRSVLWVLRSRMGHVPAGYTRKEVGGVDSAKLLDFVTAKGQCEGFGLDAAGKRTIAPRVEERVKYLLKLANSGSKPGRFAALINYAQDLAKRQCEGKITEEDLFEGLSTVGGVAVTGRAYSWMTGSDAYHPGGSFVKIPDSLRGLLGGNRFFTLVKRKEK
jgi:hypothetical protein